MGLNVDTLTIDLYNGLLKGNSGVVSPITGVQGDLLYHDGTDWVVLSAGTSGKYLKTTGVASNPMWDSLPSFTIGEGNPDNSVGIDGSKYIDTIKNLYYIRTGGVYVLTRILHSWEREIMATSAGISGDCSAGATSGTYTFTMDSAGVWANLQTAVGSGNPARINLDLWARVDHKPESMVLFKFPASTTSERVYVGMSSNGATGFTNSDTPAGEYLAIRYSTVAGDTTFQFIMKGVGVQLISDSLVTPTVSTAYLLWMKYDPSTDNGDLMLFNGSGALLASVTLNGSALTDSSQLITQAVVWSQSAGGGGQRTIAIHKIGGRVWLP